MKFSLYLITHSLPYVLINEASLFLFPYNTHNLVVSFSDTTTVLPICLLLHLSHTQPHSIPTYLPTYDAHNLFSTYFQIKILVYTSQLFLCRGVCLTFSLVRVCEKCLKTKSWNSQKNSELLYLISHTQIFPAINLVSTEFTKYSK